MNSVMDTILQRSSVRAYADREVEKEKREAVIEAAMRAPTGGNLMAYSIIEVADRKKKERLAVTCDNQPFIAEAPCVLLFLADYQKLYDLFRTSGVEERCEGEGRELRSPGPGELMIGVSDALVAAQTAVLAAESLGLGSCYIGDIFEHYEEHRRLFDLPDYAFPAALLTIGYPKGEYPPKRKVPRCDKKYVHFTDTYRRFDETELKKMYEPMSRRFLGLQDERTASQAADAEKSEGTEKKKAAPDPSRKADEPSQAAEQAGERIARKIWEKKYDSDFMREMRRSLRAALTPWIGEE